MERVSVRYGEREMKVVIPNRGTLSDLCRDVCNVFEVAHSQHTLQPSNSRLPQSTALSSLARPAGGGMLSLNLLFRGSVVPSGENLSPLVHSGSKGDLLPPVGAAQFMTHKFAVRAPTPPLVQTNPSPVDLSMIPTSILFQFWLHLGHACLEGFVSESPPRPLERIPCIRIQLAASFLEGAARDVGINDYIISTAIKHWLNLSPEWVGCSEIVHCLWLLCPTLPSPPPSLLYHLSKRLSKIAHTKRLHEWILPQCLGLNSSYLDSIVSWIDCTILSENLWGTRGLDLQHNNRKDALPDGRMSDAFNALAITYADVRGGNSLTLHRVLTLAGDLGLLKFFQAPLQVWAAAFLLTSRTFHRLSTMESDMHGRGGAQTESMNAVDLSTSPVSVSSLSTLFAYLCVWHSSSWVFGAVGVSSSSSSGSQLITPGGTIHSLRKAYPFTTTNTLLLSSGLKALYCGGCRTSLLPVGAALATGDILPALSLLKFAGALEIMASALTRSRVEALGGSHEGCWPNTRELLGAGRLFTSRFHGIRVMDGSATDDSLSLCPAIGSEMDDNPSASLPPLFFRSVLLQRGSDGVVLEEEEEEEEESVTSYSSSILGALSTALASLESSVSSSGRVPSLPSYSSVLKTMECALEPIIKTLGVTEESGIGQKKWSLGKSTDISWAYSFEEESEEGRFSAGENPSQGSLEGAATSGLLSVTSPSSPHPAAAALRASPSTPLFKQAINAPTSSSSPRLRLLPHSDFSTLRTCNDTVASVVTAVKSSLAEMSRARRGVLQSDILAGVGGRVSTHVAPALDSQETIRRCSFCGNNIGSHATHTSRRVTNGNPLIKLPPCQLLDEVAAVGAGLEVGGFGESSPFLFGVTPCDTPGLLESAGYGVVKSSGGVLKLEEDFLEEKSGEEGEEGVHAAQRVQPIAFRARSELAFEEDLLGGFDANATADGPNTAVAPPQGEGEPKASDSRDTTSSTSPILNFPRPLASLPTPLASLKRLGRKLGALDSARQALLSASNACFVWDLPEENDSPCENEESCSSSMKILPPWTVAPFGCGNSQNPAPVYLHRPRTQWDGTTASLTLLSLTATTIETLPVGVPPSLLRSTVAWTEYHSSLLDSVEADVRREIVAWLSLLEDEEAEEERRKVLAVREELRGALGKCSAGGSAASTVMGLYISSPATQVHSSPSQAVAQEIAAVDRCLLNSCTALARCFSLRPPWASALKDLCSALNRRAQLLLPSLLKVTSNHTLSPMELPLPHPSALSFSKVSSNTGTSLLDITTWRRVYSHYHTNGESLRLLHTARMAAQEALLLDSAAMGAPQSSARAILKALDLHAIIRGELLQAVPINGSGQSGSESLLRVIMAGSGLKHNDSAEDGRVSLNSKLFSTVEWSSYLALPTYCSSHADLGSAPTGIKQMNMLGLSPSGLRVAWTLFSKLDADGDGLLNGEELANAWSMLGVDAQLLEQTNIKSSRSRKKSKNGLSDEEEEEEEEEDNEEEEGDFHERNGKSLIAFHIQRAAHLRAIRRWLTSNFTPSFPTSRHDSYSRVKSVSSRISSGGIIKCSSPLLTLLAWVSSGPSTLAHVVHSLHHKSQEVHGGYTQLKRTKKPDSRVEFRCFSYSKKKSCLVRAAYVYFAGALQKQPISKSLGSPGTDTYCRRVPTLTKKPASLFSIPAVGFPAFCEYLAWLAVHKPGVLVRALLVGDLLDERISEVSEVERPSIKIQQTMLPPSFSNEDCYRSDASTVTVTSTESSEGSVSDSETPRAFSFEDSRLTSRDARVSRQASRLSSELDQVTIFRLQPHFTRGTFAASSEYSRAAAERRRARAQDDEVPLLVSGFRRSSTHSIGTGSSSYTSDSEVRLRKDSVSRGSRRSSEKSDSNSSQGRALAATVSAFVPGILSSRMVTMWNSPERSGSSPQLTANLRSDAVESLLKAASITETVDPVALPFPVHHPVSIPRSQNPTFVLPPPILSVRSLLLSMGASWGYLDLQGFNEEDETEETLIGSKMDKLALEWALEEPLSRSASHVPSWAPLIVLSPNGIASVNTQSPQWAALPPLPNPRASNTMERVGSGSDDVDSGGDEAANRAVSRALLPYPLPDIISSSHEALTRCMRGSKSGPPQPPAAAALHTAALVNQAQSVRRRLLQRATPHTLRLFDYYLVLGLGELSEGKVPPSETSDLNEIFFDSRILERFPASDWKDCPLPDISLFAFPDGLYIEESPKPPSYFSFGLTLADGSKLHCGCITTWERMSPKEILALFMTECSEGGAMTGSTRMRVVLPNWLANLAGRGGVNVPNGGGGGGGGTAAVWSLACTVQLYLPKAHLLVSRNPAHDAIRATLTQLSSLYRKDPPSFSRALSYVILDVPLPPRGYLSVAFTLGSAHILASRPPANSFPWLDTPLEPIFQCLDASNLLTVYVALLTEQRVALCSVNTALLTPCAWALAALLFPFKWVVSFIPVLPLSMAEYLESPAPYLLGWPGPVEEAQRFTSDTVLVDLDSNTVRYPSFLPFPRIPDAQRKKLMKALGESAYGGAPPSSFGADKVPGLASSFSHVASSSPELGGYAGGGVLSPLSSPYITTSSGGGSAKAPPIFPTPLLSPPWASSKGSSSGRQGVNPGTPSGTPLNQPGTSHVLSVGSLEECLGAAGSGSVGLKSSISYGWAWSQGPSNSVGSHKGRTFSEGDEAGVSGGKANYSNNTDNNVEGDFSKKMGDVMSVAPSLQQQQQPRHVSSHLEPAYQNAHTFSQGQPPPNPVTNSTSTTTQQQLSPNFNPHAIRTAFLALLVSLLKNYARYTTYRVAAYLPAPVAAVRVNSILNTALRRAMLGRECALDTALDTTGEGGALLAASPPPGGGGGVVAAGYTLTPLPPNKKPGDNFSDPPPRHLTAEEILRRLEHATGSHLELPSQPMPALELEFNTEAFISDSPAGARSLLRFLLNTQLWNCFLQSLVPPCYRPCEPLEGFEGGGWEGGPSGTHSSVSPVKGSSPRPEMGDVWDLSARDPSFASRLPPSTRYFNATIGLKLRRLSSKPSYRLGFGGAKVHPLYSETGYLENSRGALLRHVTIPPPLAPYLPADLADALSASSLALHESCYRSGGGERGGVSEGTESHRSPNIFASSSKFGAMPLRPLSLMATQLGKSIKLGRTAQKVRGESDAVAERSRAHKAHAERRSRLRASLSR